MPLQQYVRQLRPRSEAYIPHVDKVQNFLSEAFSIGIVDDSDIPEYGSGDSCYADPGDVTDDCIINVLDIISLVNHILGTNSLEDTCAADITEDGIVNVLDVVAMVNLVLSGGDDEVADMNFDGVVNVLDIVLLLGIFLG